MASLFFNTRKPRPFQYTPIFYNEEKEKQERKKKELGVAEPKEHRFEAGELKRQWTNLDRNKLRKKQSVNYVVYLVLIGVLLYFIFF